MRFVGITLIWVGVIMLLKNIGLIQVVDSGIVWATIIIILGFSLKHGCHRHMMGGMMGKGMGFKHDQDHKGMGGGCEECGK